MVAIAIVGSGPAGYYTAEAARKKWEEARIDVIDALPIPYGLIRSGVAPDHQSIKAVAQRYEKTALGDGVRLIGNMMIGRDIAIEELKQCYDAVVLATGAPHDRTLGIDGEGLGNVFGSAVFVGWYNGHPASAGLSPDLAGERAVIIGMGNVALDVARILAKSQAELTGSDIVAHAFDALATSRLRHITILGRRGPHQIQMTPKELGELGKLERARPLLDPGCLPEPQSDAALDPGVRKSVAILRDFATRPAGEASGKPITIEFGMFASPLRFMGEGKVVAVEVERTRLDGTQAVGTGETFNLPADLVVTCIGYRTSAIPDVPFDERTGRFANEDGRIVPGLYCVGWARRGPTGTIGTNRPDSYGVVDLIADDLEGTSVRAEGSPALDRLIKARGLRTTSFRDWKRIEEAETRAARAGAPREKFVDVSAMLQSLS
jgi:ferredoxin--NADP+ reductase